MSNLAIPKWQDLVGIPFEYGGRDLTALDCYGLVMLLHKRLGITIPDFISSDNAGINAANFAIGLRTFKWQRMPDRGMHIGEFVLLALGDGWFHCGMVVGPDEFVHTWEKTGGVVKERLSPWKSHIKGYYIYGE